VLGQRFSSTIFLQFGTVLWPRFLDRVVVPYSPDHSKKTWYSTSRRRVFPPPRGRGMSHSFYFHHSSRMLFFFVALCPPFVHSLFLEKVHAGNHGNVCFPYVAFSKPPFFPPALNPGKFHELVSFPQQIFQSPPPFFPFFFRRSLFTQGGVIVVAFAKRSWFDSCPSPRPPMAAPGYLLGGALSQLLLLTPPIWPSAPGQVPNPAQKRDFRICVFP